MSRGKRTVTARESWLSDGNDEHFGDAMLLCQLAGSGECAHQAKCGLEGFCFRGLRSAEVRRGVEKRLERIEADLCELMVLAVPQRARLAIEKIRAETNAIRDNVLHFPRPEA